MTPKKLRSSKTAGGASTNVARPSTRAVDTSRKRGCPPTTRISPPTSSQRTPASSPIEPLAASPTASATAATAYGATRAGAPATNGRRSSPVRRPSFDSWVALPAAVAGRTPPGPATASAARASTRSSGYSQIPLNRIGATIATSELARTPPAEIRR